MRSAMLCGLGMVFAVQAWAVANPAREQEAYYHMHQAEELLELFQKGKCTTAQTSIDTHLRSANQIFDQVPDSPLEPLFRKLVHVRNALFRGKGHSSAQDLAKVRELIREVADHQELSHESKWHDELNGCN